MAIYPFDSLGGGLDAAAAQAACEAAIAAADLPSAAEVATAVGAQAACAAAITAANLPTAAQVATAVGAQAACAAAITAANLPTAAQVATAVGAQAACAAAIVAANLPTAVQVAEEVGSSSTVSTLMESACKNAVGGNGRTAGSGVSTGAGTTGDLGLLSFFGPGEGMTWAVYGWHIRVYGAASDVAIVSGSTTVNLGRSMPAGAVNAVAWPFPLYLLGDNEVMTFTKTSGASVELTVFAAPFLVV
jgi:hypothetical protein